MINVLYFAWVRSGIGLDHEAIETDAATVGALLDELRTRSPRHAETLAELSKLRLAVNQSFVELDAPISAGDEVAIFPPMTGG